jgi:hypothetical protein
MTQEEIEKILQNPNLDLDIYLKINELVDEVNELKTNYGLLVEILQKYQPNLPTLPKLK